MKFIILAFAYLLICLATTPSKAYADTVGLGIFPPISQIVADPPASVLSPITIENPQDKSISLNIVFKEFRPSPKENGDIEYIDTPLPPIFEKMQVFDNDHVVTQVTLGPKQKKSLALHIGLPKGEKPRDYYFSILFVSKEGNLVDSTQSQAVVGIATNVLLTVSPSGPTQGRIAEFSAPFFLRHGPVPFKVRVENTSDHYITPKGLITIKNMFGQTIGKVDLLSVNILSKTTRIMPSARQESVIDPKALWNEKFLLGFYTARLSVGLSDEGPIYNKTIRFLAFPIELLVGFAVSLFIVILIVRRIREKQISKS